MLRARSTLQSPVLKCCWSRIRFASNVIQVDNPYTLETFVEVEEIDEPAMLKLVDNSARSYRNWAKSSIQERVDLCKNIMAHFKEQGDRYAEQICGQTGKPLKQALGEISTTIHRANKLIELAGDALSDHTLPDENGVERKFTREPIGTVLLLCPWNYPMLCSINGIIPAILSGNSVLLKHSERSSVCADAFEESFKLAGAPQHLLQAFHGSHERIAHAIAHPAIAYVQFTGSVGGGQSVYKTVSNRFIDVGLELGGKDAAYICNDADIDVASAGVIDGAIYNAGQSNHTNSIRDLEVSKRYMAGQSCCAVERIYVHKSVYDAFVEKALSLVTSYKLGDPMRADTTLGPMAQAKAPSFLAHQIKQARLTGAKILCGGKPTTDSEGKGRFFEPTLAVDCNHEMSLMVEESFGPVVAMAAVESDEEAVKLINDSPYGLTASVWSNDNDHADHLLPQLNVGTVFQNRCDYLDPELPWSGRKSSGKGISLSHLAYNSFTRTKSYNLRRSK